jgi:hypothetical protein
MAAPIPPKQLATITAALKQLRTIAGNPAPTTSRQLLPFLLLDATALLSNLSAKAPASQAKQSLQLQATSNW